jgi:metallophosphoesterase superfamily enzyme
MFAISSSFAAKKVVALGDLEGNYPKLLSLIEESGAFIKNYDETWSTKKGYHFVFLGDAVDKAAGNITVVETLLKIKKMNPESVTLILGNRDISKMTMYNYMNMSFDEVYETLKHSYRFVLVTNNV